VDDRRQVHHAYLPHKPFAWLVALAAAALALRLLRAGRPAGTALAVLGVNVMLHLVLDTTAGGIRWLWPWTQAEFALSQPTARFYPWYLNFVLHWTFALEMVLLMGALWIWRRRRGEPG
jgi:inner membrane protein